MKSKTAFFNKGICLNYLKRYWPFWLGYLVIALMIIPGNILPMLNLDVKRAEQDMFWYIMDMNRTVLHRGRDALALSAVFGVIAAMVMYSFMYNNRSVSMMCSLPIRRETLFVTAFVTGLVPMLIIDLVVVAATLPTVTSGVVDAINLWRLLGMLVLSNIAFYCFGVFCAVLTGNIVVLPVVYLILNTAVVLAEQAVRSVLDVIVYGFASFRGHLTAFSPIVAATDWFYPRSETESVIENGVKVVRETGVFNIDHYYVLFIYCAVGLALAALALCIYRRRDMECAGDVVAVPILKPIFKYCLCLGFGICFGLVVFGNVFYRVSGGLPTTLVLLAFILVGAFIGYFAAEMLMQKTLRVFRGKWAGYIVSAAVITAFVFAAEYDMTGYEKRIPDIDDVKHVTIGYYEGATVEKPESIEAILDYHKLLLESKSVNETADITDRINIKYTLADGSRVDRYYPISKDDAQLADENSCINVLFPVVNLQEAIDKRASTTIPVTEDSVQNGNLNSWYVDEEGEYHHTDIELTEEQVTELYNDCILPDASEGKLKRIFPVNNDEYYNCATTATLSFELMDDEHEFYYYDFVIYMDAERTANWITENTEIELLPLKEADWQNYENDSVYMNYYRPASGSIYSSAVYETRAVG